MTEERKEACFSEIAALPPGQDSTAPERRKGTLIARDGRGLRPDSTGERSSIFASLRLPQPAQLDASNFNKVTDPIPSIPSQHAGRNSPRQRTTATDAKDILGHVYDWLGATKSLPKESPKGWRGGANQYFTPKSIVSLIVDTIGSYLGHVHDPAMNFGGFKGNRERSALT